MAPADPGPLAAPLVLAGGELRLALALEGGLSDGADAVNLAPDLWYGLGPRLTLGVRHSYRSEGAVGAGRGLCVARCLPGEGRYRGVALAARFPLATGATELAGELATDVLAWSPAVASVTIGAVARWRVGRAWAQATPRLALGVLGRAGGNRERASIDLVVGGPLVGWLGAEIGVGAIGPATTSYFADTTAPVRTQLMVDPAQSWRLGLVIGTDDLRAGADLHVFVAATVEVRVTS